MIMSFNSAMHETLNRELWSELFIYIGQNLTKWGIPVLTGFRYTLLHLNAIWLTEDSFYNLQYNSLEIILKNTLC